MLWEILATVSIQLASYPLDNAHVPLTTTYTEDSILNQQLSEFSENTHFISYHSINGLYILEQTTITWTTFQSIQAIHLKLFKLIIIIPIEKKLPLSETQASTYKLWLLIKIFRGTWIFANFRGIAPPQINDHSLLLRCLSSSLS